MRVLIAKPNNFKKWREIFKLIIKKLKTLLEFLFRVAISCPLLTVCFFFSHVSPQGDFQISSDTRIDNHIGHDTLNKTKTHSNTFSINWQFFSLLEQNAIKNTLKDIARENNEREFSPKKQERRWQSRYFVILLLCKQTAASDRGRKGIVLIRNGKPFDNERKIKIFILVEERRTGEMDER